MDHRPSVIAAAATLVSMDPHFTRKAVELKISSVSQCRILENVSSSFVYISIKYTKLMFRLFRTLVLRERFEFRANN